jgi:hypothetical protein
MGVNVHTASRALLIAASLATGACAASKGVLEVRALPDPAAAKLHPGDRLLAEAEGQLALGNPGLALEGFRKALRIEGDSSKAFSGIAACYAAMGRYDIARSNYESGLALDPHNPAMLTALAGVLDLLGNSAGAADARADALAAAVPRPADRSATVTVALPPARSADDQPASEASLLSTGANGGAAAGPLASSMEIDHPLRRPAPKPGVRNPALAEASSAYASRLSAPRLERLSPGEVALVTTAAPIWTAEIVSRTRTSTTVRWVPVRAASARPNIRLLNAARRAGLAARARSMLVDRGWRRIEIADAAVPASKSLVIYPAGHAALGRSLAAQFNCEARKAGTGDILLVFLGRDRADRNIVNG